MQYETYNLGHNILEYYSVLVPVRFTQSSTIPNKLGVRVASRVAERL